MPSIFSHAIVGISIGKAASQKKQPTKFWILSLLCPIIPDLDVLGLKIGIEYHSFWGHRGISHSLFFALILGILVSSLCFREEGLFTKSWFFNTIYFFAITATHGILDAFTNGGGGVAILSPFCNERFTFWVTPITVSPLSLKVFFGEQGLRVILNELLWVWLPSLCFAYTGRVLFLKNRR